MLLSLRRKVLEQGFPMANSRLHTLQQADAFSSPWPLSTRLRLLAWSIIWFILFRPSPKPMVQWRRSLLRLFGARIEGRPFVASSARIKMPWNLTLHDRACLGERSEIYNLTTISLGARCTIAQQAYLCAGTHDFTAPNCPLVVGPIDIGADAFIGARAFILPGVVIAEGAVIGACAVVSRDMPSWTLCAGNPCVPLKPRERRSWPDPV